MPSSSWNAHAPAGRPSSSSSATASEPEPNSSHHSFRYAGVWKKVPPASAMTRGVQSRVRNTAGSSTSSTRIDVSNRRPDRLFRAFPALQGEQRVVVRPERRPERTVRLHVDRAQAVLLEHGEPLV